MHTASCTVYPVPDDAVVAENRAKVTNRYRNHYAHKYRKRPQRRTFVLEVDTVHAIQPHRYWSYTLGECGVLSGTDALIHTSDAKRT